MYGLIGKLRALPGKRDTLASILIEAVGDGMPGCLSYVVGHDRSDPDVLWITEVWDGRESHTASLSLPAVASAVEEARKVIGGFETSIPFDPIAGLGLKATAQGLAETGPPQP